MSGPVEQQEAAIARMLLALRESMGVSQEVIARRMRAAGHRWHQTTVWKTENCDRRLSFTEGMTLADIYGVDVALFDTTTDAVRVAAERMAEAAKVAEEAEAEHVKARAAWLALTDQNHEEAA